MATMDDICRLAFPVTPWPYNYELHCSNADFQHKSKLALSKSSYSSVSIMKEDLSSPN